MKTLKLVFTFSILFITTIMSAQTTKLVEEMALYHLDSLTKTDTSFEHFKYFTNGYIDNEKIFPFDTLAIYFKLKVSNHSIQTPFTNLTIKEDSTIRNFWVPNRLRKNGGVQPLTIYRHIKTNTLFYVYFQIDYESGGQCAMIIMDHKGNLIRRNIANFIY